MSLQPQNVPIDFSMGVDTKSDPKVVQGKMLDVRNAVMTSPGQYQKRAGYVALPVTVENHVVQQNSAVPASVSAGAFIAPFNNEIVTGDGLNQYSYNPGSSTQTFKGTNVACTITSGVVVNQSPDSNGALLTPDWCSNGTLRGFVAYSVSAGVLATIQDISSGQILSANYAFSGVAPRMVSVNGVITLIYQSNSGTSLLYSQWYPGIGWSNPTTLLSDNYSGTLPYDVIWANSKLYIAYGTSTNTTKVAAYTSSFVLSASISKSENPNNNGSSNMSVVTDSSNVWVSYFDGSSHVRNFIVNAALNATVVAPYTVATQSGVSNVTATLTTAGATIFYDVPLTQASSVVYYANATTGGTVTSSGTFINSLSLISKAWTYNNIPYVAMAYSSTVQPIGAIGGLFNSVVAGGVGCTLVGTYGYLQLATTSGGTGLSAAPVSNGVVSFVAPLQVALAGFGYTRVQADFTVTGQSSVVLGANLITASATTAGYDGTTVNENNFYLFPEFGSVTTTTGSNLGVGQYGYIFVWEWTDAQGNVHQSAPSATYSITVTSGANQSASISIPRLYLTSKQHVVLVPYRTVVNGSIYYRCFAAKKGLVNDSASTTSHITWTDPFLDANITGGQQLYTTGGEVANAAPPPSSYVSTFQNRVMLTPSENPGTLWFSKQRLPGTPVEFSLSLTFSVGTTTEKVVAHKQMDANFIILTRDQVFGMTGEGPAPNGLNDDFSTPTLIPTMSGCRDAASLVLTPVGLMYMSPKGLMLLNRGLTDEYIGADVEAYNSYTVTGAAHTEGTTQVRFTLSSGIALVYDYFAKTWDVFNNQAAVSACATGLGSYAYLQSNGVAMLETAGTYTDNGAFIPLYLQTNWIQVAGLQGIQRIYDLLILGTYYGTHQLQVTVAYDFNPATAQTIVVSPTTGAPYQWRVPLQRQVCQAIQLTIQDVQSGSYNQGLALTGITLRAGVKPGTNKLSAAKTFG